MEKAIREFNIDLAEKVALDVGVGIGGFTDCLLQHGARVVYTVDEVMVSSTLNSVRIPELFY